MAELNNNEQTIKATKLMKDKWKNELSVTLSFTGWTKKVVSISFSKYGCTLNVRQIYLHILEESLWEQNNAPFVLPCVDEQNISIDC